MYPKPKADTVLAWMSGVILVLLIAIALQTLILNYEKDRSAALREELRKCNPAAAESFP